MIGYLVNESEWYVGHLVQSTRAGKTRLSRKKYRALSAELKDIGHGQVIAVVRAPAYHDFSIRAKSLMSKSLRSKYHTLTKHVPNTNKSFTVSQLD